MGKPLRRTQVSGAYVLKTSSASGGHRGGIDLVTPQRLRAIDDKLDLAIEQAKATLAEIRLAVRK